MFIHFFHDSIIIEVTLSISRHFQPEIEPISWTRSSNSRFRSAEVEVDCGETHALLACPDSRLGTPTKFTTFVPPFTRLALGHCER